MMSSVQQPPVYYVASTSQGQSQVLLQMRPVNEVQSQPINIYLRKHHKVLGILQMSVGCLCFMMETLGTCIGPTWGITYTGFYAGIIFFVAGLLGYLAYERNNLCFIIACMVMSIVASLIVVSGIMTSLFEMKVLVPFYSSRDNRKLQIVKESIIIGSCAFELFLSIAHASFTCATCCRCCWPIERRAAVSSRAVPTTLIIQPPSYTDPPPSGAIFSSSAAPEAAPLPTKALIPYDSVGAESSNEPPPYSQLS